MQDRYAGDVGDYGKIGLLRCLEKQGFNIGINWYLVPTLDVEKNVIALVEEKIDSIREAFDSKESVSSLAIDIGYCCG